MRNDPADALLRVTIASDGDILRARQQVRAVALDLSFSLTEVIGIVTSLSEMARNMLLYAGRGEIIVEIIHDGNRTGLKMTARDEGPGISDIHKALLDGYSTSGGLGMGLPGIRRLMDEFEMTSELRKGTTVVVRKWLGRR